jgi:lipoprotein-releasing system permease protein
MFFLALRHLMSRKKQSLLTLLGIILGTTAYVAISGMMMGFQTFIIDQLVNNDSHIRINAREELLTSTSLNAQFFSDSDKKLINWIKAPSGRKDNAYILAPKSWMDFLENHPGVVGSSPQLVVQALASAGKILAAVRLIGSIPQKQLQVTRIDQYMLKGKFTDIATGGNRIIVGEGLLGKLGAEVGENITLSVGKGEGQSFKIVGKFLLGIKALDDTTIFAHLPDVQRLNQTPSRVSDIAIRLIDVTSASDLAYTWNQMGQEKVQSWDQSNEGIMSVFKTQDIVRNVMTISILIVAGFGIYNILSLAVSSKKREIAILRSMGFGAWDITALFLIQGIILGLIGGLIGCLLGYVACYFMTLIEVSANRGLGGNHLMVSFDGFIYLKAFFLAFFSSTFAGFFPAQSAGRMQPIDIIRSENS